MRMSPDGQKEVFEAPAPLRPRRAQIVLIYGDGLPPKACVGVSEIEDSYWLEMVNRFRSGTQRYDRIERLRFGVVPLAAQPLQDEDSYMSHGGSYFHQGKASEKKDEKVLELGHRSVDEADRYPSISPIWLVRHKGGAMLFMVPGDVESDSIASQMEDFFVGEFTLEAVNGGQFTAMDPPVAPGWNQVLASAPVQPNQARKVPEMVPA